MSGQNGSGDPVFEMEMPSTISRISSDTPHVAKGTSDNLRPLLHTSPELELDNNHDLARMAHDARRARRHQPVVASMALDALFFGNGRDDGTHDRQGARVRCRRELRQVDRDGEGVDHSVELVGRWICSCIVARACWLCLDCSSALLSHTHTLLACGLAPLFWVSVVTAGDDET